LTADALASQTLTVITANAKVLDSAASTISTQLTSASLELTGALTATGLVATNLTATGDVAFEGTATLGVSGFGPSLVPVIYLGPTLPFVLPPYLGANSTVLFDATLPAGSSCLLPANPTVGLTLYVANLSTVNSVLVTAPAGVSFARVTAPLALLASFTVPLLLSVRLVWTGTVWLESAP